VQENERNEEDEEWDNCSAEEIEINDPEVQIYNNSKRKN